MTQLLIADFFKETFMLPETKSVIPAVFYRTLSVEGWKSSIAELVLERLPPFCSCTAFRRRLICSAI